MFFLPILSVCLVLPGSVVETENVVFLPVMIASHTRAFCMVAESLAKLGHNTWCGLSVTEERRKKEGVYPGVNTFNMLDVIDFDEDWVISNIESSAVNITEDGRPNVAWVHQYHEATTELIFRAMKSGRMVDFIKNLKPDLLVIGFYPRVNEFVALSYILDVPFAIFSCLHDYATSGVPFNPMSEMYNFEYFRTQASLLEQLGMLCKLWWPMFYDTFYDNGYIAQLAPTKPKVTTSELMRQAEIFIIESDHLVDYPRPGLPNFKYVGGVSSEPAHPLVEPFKSFVERAEQSRIGIAVVSFGSLFMHFTSDIEAKLIKAFQQLKLHVIWRVDITSPNPDKILTSTWIPQNDLLGHKNTRVFISHCGAHSQSETLYHAVPLVCVPLFFDQDYNTERILQKGYGLGLRIVTASVEEIVTTVENVTNSKEIRSTVSKASEIFHILFKNPREEAAFWLDHVMKYGGSYMRYSGQKMSMFELMMPEFLMFVTGAVVGLVFVLFILLLKYVCDCARTSGHLKRD